MIGLPIESIRSYGICLGQRIVCILYAYICLFIGHHSRMRHSQQRWFHRDHLVFRLRYGDFAFVESLRKSDCRAGTNSGLMTGHASIFSTPSESTLYSQSKSFHHHRRTYLHLTTSTLQNALPISSLQHCNGTRNRLLRSRSACGLKKNLLRLNLLNARERSTLLLWPPQHGWANPQSAAKCPRSTKQHWTQNHSSIPPHRSNTDDRVAFWSEVPFPVEICLHNRLSILNSFLVRAYVQFDSRVAILIRTVNISWTPLCGMTGTRSLIPTPEDSTVTPSPC